MIIGKHYSQMTAVELREYTKRHKITNLNQKVKDLRSTVANHIITTNISRFNQMTSSVIRK